MASEKVVMRIKQPMPLVVWFLGATIVSLAGIVLPSFLWAKRVFENRVVDDQIQALQVAHDDWTARLGEHLGTTEASAARLSRLLSVEVESDHELSADDFDEILSLNADGTYRSRHDFHQPLQDAGIIIPATAVLDASERLFYLQAKRLIELYQTRSSADFMNTWVRPQIGGIVAYWPSAPRFFQDLDSSGDYSNSVWMTLASTLENPTRKPRWTTAIYDRVAQKWTVSAVAPFFIDGRFGGSLGHDVPIEAMLGRMMRANDGAREHILLGNGTLLASDIHHDQIRDTHGEVRIFDTADLELSAALFEAQKMPTVRTRIIDDPDQSRIFFATHLETQDWYLISEVSRRKLVENVASAYRPHWFAGAAMMVAMVLIPIFLISWVILPAIRRLLDGADKIRAGDLEYKFALRGSGEFADLADSLNTMVSTLQSTIFERQQALASLADKEAEARTMLLERERNSVELRLKLDVIERQQEAIRTMSIPIIQVWEGVIALPVVGELDTARVENMTAAVLDAIVQRQANVLILDLTGVGTVNDTTADHVINVLRAVRLLGARGIVTGLRADVARRIVSLGLNLSNFTTMGSLREALHSIIATRSKVRKPRPKVARND
jgi:anti-anti-sigma regulatory factor/HAMP domain-containing protein